MAQLITIDYLKKEYDKINECDKARYVVCIIFENKKMPVYLEKDLEDAKRKIKANKQVYEKIILIDLETMENVYF